MTDEHAPADNKKQKRIDSNNLPDDPHRSLQQPPENCISRWMLNEVHIKY